jgi:hypothetical protein
MRHSIWLCFALIASLPADSMLIEVLDIMRKYFQTHLKESLAMLREM